MALRGTITALCALAAFVFAPAVHAAFPGLNGKIVFDAQEPAFTKQLMTVDPDGTAEGPLAPESINSDEQGAWSPDGSKIVFTKFDNLSQGEIWVMNADGTGQTKLTDGPTDFRPAFSGDGTKIAFMRNWEIWVMNADGSDETQITTLPGDNEAYGPVFSPDSTKIAFTRFDPFLGLAVWIMNADGSGLTNVTPTGNDAFEVDPDFSPDGQTLVFSNCPETIEGCSTEWRIAVVSVAGGAITDITAPPADHNDFAPVFSPDGTRVAFDRHAPQIIPRRADTGPEEAAITPGGSQIQVVGAGGGAVTGISSGVADTFPDWQPRARPPGGTGTTTPNSDGTLSSKSKNTKKCRGVRVTIKTTNGKDVIVGTPGRDVVHGQRGDDVIKGLKGNDRLCGGRGSDKIRGGKGRDVIFGGDDPDYLVGGPQFDRIFGGTPDAPVELHIDQCSGGEDFMQNCQKRG